MLRLCDVRDDVVRVSDSSSGCRIPASHHKTYGHKPIGPEVTRILWWMGWIVCNEVGLCVHILECIFRSINQLIGSSDSACVLTLCALLLYKHIIIIIVLSTSCQFLVMKRVDKLHVCNEKWVKIDKTSYFRLKIQIQICWILRSACVASINNSQSHLRYRYINFPYFVQNQNRVYYDDIRFQ